MSLPEHATEFLGSIISERGLSKNTTDAYRRDLAQYQETIELRRDLDQTEVVHAHLISLRERGLKDTSVARKLASIRAYHRFVVTEGYERDDPTSNIPSTRISMVLPRALTIDEVARVIETPDCSTPLGIRDSSILEVLYATGCRVSELAMMDLHDLDFESNLVIVTGKGEKQRVVPLGSYAQRSLTLWLNERINIRVPGSDPGALFLTVRGRRLSRQTIWRIVRKAGRAAGIDQDRLSPHVLRHSAATHMVEGGADLRTVQEMLGHASLTTTQVYTKVSPEHLREIVIVSHPRGR